MNILGIDYGRKKMGLAVSDGNLVEPWKVLRVKDFEDALIKIKKVLEVLQVEKVVVGISEGEIAEESKKFAERIGAETYDETLSTYEAQRLAREANIKRKKRKDLEDAFAAAVMLQSYLDSYV